MNLPSVPSVSPMRLWARGSLLQPSVSMVHSVTIPRVPGRCEDEAQHRGDSLVERSFSSNSTAFSKVHSCTEVRLTVGFSVSFRSCTESVFDLCNSLKLRCEPQQARLTKEDLFSNASYHTPSHQTVTVMTTWKRPRGDLH